MRAANRFGPYYEKRLDERRGPTQRTRLTLFLPLASLT